MVQPPNDGDSECSLGSSPNAHMDFGMRESWSTWAGSVPWIPGYVSKMRWSSACSLVEIPELEMYVLIFVWTKPSRSV